MEEKESENKEGAVFTLNRDTIYGGVIVILVALLTLSVLTNGFGGCSCVGEGGECPACPLNAECTGECPDCPGLDAYAGVPTVSVATGDLPHLGDANAVATVIEVSDYQCPYCWRFHVQTVTPLKASHVDTGKVKLYFRDFPLSFHANAMNAAVAARCADEQGRFWEMNAMLFENQETWSGLGDVTETFTGYAGTLGIDSAAFSTCYSSGVHESAINADMSSASGSGVQGTPGSFIIIPKDSVDAESFKETVSGLQMTYGDGIKLYHDDDNVIVFVGGAYPYEVFTAVLDTVE